MPPAAVRQLIESRNVRFEQAVDEQDCPLLKYIGALYLTFFERLLMATPPAEDPITLLVAAATNFVPVIQEPCLHDNLKTIPPPSERPSITQVISEIKTSNWYINQIVDQHTMEAKEAQTGIVPKY